MAQNAHDAFAASNDGLIEALDLFASLFPDSVFSAILTAAAQALDESTEIILGQRDVLKLVLEHLKAEKPDDAELAALSENF